MLSYWIVNQRPANPVPLLDFNAILIALSNSSHTRASEPLLDTQYLHGAVDGELQRSPHGHPPPDNRAPQVRPTEGLQNSDPKVLTPPIVVTPPLTATPSAISVGIRSRVPHTNDNIRRVDDGRVTIGCISRRAARTPFSLRCIPPGHEEALHIRPRLISPRVLAGQSNTRCDQPRVRGRAVWR